MFHDTFPGAKLGEVFSRGVAKKSSPTDDKSHQQGEHSGGF